MSGDYRSEKIPLSGKYAVDSAVNIPQYVAMNAINALFAVIETFAAARGISEARISTLVFRDGKRIDAIRRGADVGSRTLMRAMKWFSANWPEGAVWPADVPRPSPSTPLDEAAE
jgi:hypothetical protein